MRRSKNWAKVTVEFHIPLVGNHTERNSILKSLEDAMEDFSGRIPHEWDQVGNTFLLERTLRNGGTITSDQWDGGEATATISWEVVNREKLTASRK